MSNYVGKEAELLDLSADSISLAEELVRNLKPDTDIGAQGHGVRALRAMAADFRAGRYVRKGQE